MGANQSASTVDYSHVRIWNNLAGIQNPATRAQMLETLLSSPEYISSAKRAGVYSFSLQWLSGYRRGEIYAWSPYLTGQMRTQGQGQGQGQGQRQQRGQEIIEHPAPKKAHDYFTECCDLLGIDETMPLSSEVIRSAYKKSAIRVHPDRGGNPALFDAVTRASAYLQKIVDRVAGIKIQTEMVTQHVPTTSEQLQQYAGQRQQAVQTIQDRAPISLSAKNLDMSMFNKLFDENKLPDPEKDDGYGDWLKNTGQDDSVKDNQTLRKKFALDTFNKTFETEGTGSGAQVRQTQPSALILQPSSGITLGGEKPSDYTAPYGGRGVQYTDLKSAYTSDSTFSQNVGSFSQQGRPRDLKEMERARSAPVELSAEERRGVNAWDAQQKATEEARVRRMAEQDVMSSRYHESLQRRLTIQ